VFGTPSSDEDCLYLNVWTPPDRASSPAPVMVFVHGGSFLYGSGTFPLYDGTNLARASGHVVVTLNYRLGALGYLSNAALRAEDPSNPTSGEYGTLDQIAAFTWVQKNVAAFGGDPSNVTIFGESAGATSMALHLVSPKSAGLFKNVIAESIAAIDGSPAATMALGDTNGATFASALGCTDAASLLTCLRAQPVSALLAPGGSSASVAFWPVADGVVIPSDPMALFSAGTFTKVPTVLGNNKNEGTLFVMNDPPTDDASYLAYANQLVPGQGAAIVAQYPIASYGGSYEAAAAAALNDGGFLCPTRKIARAVVATSTPVYRYDFVHVMEDPPFPNLGSFHGSELPFVFGNPIEGVFTLEADEEPLSTLMMSYWANMAAAGNPNGAGLFAWPAYQATTEPEVVLETTPSTETELAQATCDFWDGIED
jgi:para-nitrobenzyl esterase